MGFEGHRLNDMIDLVEQAKPADLESAGEALKEARNAIAAAAKELGEHIDRVDWEGEAGQAFRKWGKNLVKDTHKLSDFADAACGQMAAAAAGLASVRSSMPPRDHRADPKAVEDLPAPKRVDGNEEYAAAVKAEKHRQEAINQMNRLASFYVVAQNGMAEQEPPRFSAMPDVGMPSAQSDAPGAAPGATASPDAGAGHAQTAATRLPADTAIAASGDAGGTASGDPTSSRIAVPSSSAPSAISVPEYPVGTEIDSVHTLPPQTVNPAPGPQAQAPGPVPTPTDMAPVPPQAGRRFPTTGNGPTGRAPGPAGGTKQPMPALGRPGTGGPRGAHETPGRGPAVPMARTDPTAQGRSSTTGPVTSGQPPAGRSISGGTPRTLGGPGQRPGVPDTTGAQRAQGVIGGRAMPNPVYGSGGSRTSRIPVIGAGAAPQSAAGSRQVRRGAAPTPGGVVGAPGERRSAAASRKSGFSAGGSGLVRGPASSRRDQQESERAQRPDDVAEDEEMRLSGERRHVRPTSD